MADAKPSSNGMQRRFDQFCKETSFHGFIDHYNAKKRSSWRAWFWISMIIVFAGLATYMIIKVFIDFKNSPLITTYTVKPSGGLPFPKVQICFTNTINKTKVKESGLHPAIIDYVKHGLGEATMQSQIIPPLAGNAFVKELRESIEFVTVLFMKNRDKAIEEAMIVGKLSNLSEEETMLSFKALENKLKDIFSGLRYSNDTDYFAVHYERIKPLLDVTTTFLSVKKVLERYGNDVNKLFVACIFLANPLYCESYIKPVFDIRFGRCFLFYINETQSLAGMGLQMLINANVENAWPNIPHLEDGVYVRINKEYNPTGLNTFLLPLGAAAQVTFEAKHYSLTMSEKYGWCNTNMDWKVSKFEVYSSNVCRLECVHQGLMKKCGCTMEIDPKFIADVNNYNSCMSTFKFPCMNKHMGSDISADCLKQCKPACDYWEYKPFVTTSKFPSHAMQNILRKQQSTVTSDELEKNYIYLHLAFGDLEYAQITQSPALTFSGFVSQIGGHLGLFLGASLFSLVQLIVFIINSCCTRKLDEEPKKEKVDTLYTTHPVNPPTIDNPNLY